MNKNVDYLKDILQHTMNLNRLRWSYEELLIDVNYYKHMYNDNKKRIDKAIEYIENNSELYYGDELYDEYQKIIDILKGSDSDD